jgi:hypothetical protein
MTPLDAFHLLDLRAGRILRAAPNEKARKPAYKLWIDFAPLGVKQSSAQPTDLYSSAPARRVPRRSALVRPRCRRARPRQSRPASSKPRCSLSCARL